MKPTAIKLHDTDNVAIAVEDIPKGSRVFQGLITFEDIPQGHKIALQGIPEGGEIRRYGVVLGYALKDIEQGGWVNESSLCLPVPPDLEEVPFGVNVSARLPAAPRRSFLGYPNPWGEGPAGTRNLLGIHTTVQCVTGVLNIAVERIRRELLPKYPCVDGVVPVNHAYGCGVAISAPDAVIPIRTLKNLIRHPNFGGEVMVVGLGCEKLTVEMLLEKEDNTEENVLLLQELRGFDCMVKAVLDMAEIKLKKLNERRRKDLPLSELLVGLQCGGSDAFSGVTANPAAGFAADMIVEAGGTVLFSEATEVRDGAHLLIGRCVDNEARLKMIDEMRWYDAYLARGGADRSANPTPGNKKGGLSNIVEKAMGSIAKSGSAPIVEVLSPAEKPTRHGMIYANTPASDFVCGTCQLASGIGLQVFMTGRGTPYGLAAVPVIKVCSRNAMKEQWGDLIDFNAGPIATGDMTVQEAGLELFNQMIDTASGRRKPAAEKYGIHNDLCLFNPAPIT
jgi:galactarate dehydratase